MTNQKIPEEAVSFVLTPPSLAAEEMLRREGLGQKPGLHHDVSLPELEKLSENSSNFSSSSGLTQCDE